LLTTRPAVDRSGARARPREDPRRGPGDTIHHARRAVELVNLVRPSTWPPCR
jgi:hypothetical protein